MDHEHAFWSFIFGKGERNGVEFGWLGMVCVRWEYWCVGGKSLREDTEMVMVLVVVCGEVNVPVRPGREWIFV